MDFVHGLSKIYCLHRQQTFNIELDSATVIDVYLKRFADCIGKEPIMYRYDISEMETANQQLLQRPTVGLRIQNNRKINKQDKK